MATPPGRVVIVREARPSDARSIMSMIEALAALGGAQSAVKTSASELKRAMSGEEARFGALLAEVDDRAAGFASYTVAYSIWHGECYVSIEDIFVQESYRESGVARALLGAIARLCHEQNCRARWEFPLHSSAARSFYEGLGVSVSEKGVCDWSRASIESFLEQDSAG